MEALEETDCGINPLLIDHVVEAVMKNLSSMKEFDTLLSLRRVCHLWENLATRVLRENPDHIKTFGKLWIDRIKDHDTVFLQNTNHLPCSSFSFIADIFHKENEHQYNQTLTLIAPIIRRLCIIIDFSSRQDLTSTLLEVMKMPALTSLEFDVRRLNVDDMYFVYKIFYANQQSFCDNLKSFSISFPPKTVFENIHARLKTDALVISIFDRFSPLRNLRKLCLDTNLTDELLHALSNLSFSIEDLSLHVRQSSFKSKSFKACLQNWSHSLKILKLLSLSGKDNITLEFPDLPILKKFELQAWRVLQDSVILRFDCFTYSKSLPSIDSLEFNCWCNQLDWMDFLNKKSTTLKNLRLPPTLPHALLVPEIAKNFPNLKKLEIFYPFDDSKILQAIFMSFDFIEELTILRNHDYSSTFPINIDNVLCGLSQSDCQFIINCCTFEQISKLRIRKDLPSLCNLTRLKKLDIQDVLRYQATITDVTGCLALLKMPSLTHLVTSQSKMSKICLRNLAERYPLYVDNVLQKVWCDDTEENFSTAHKNVFTSLLSYLIKF